MPLTDYTLEVLAGLDGNWSSVGSGSPLDDYGIIDGQAILTEDGTGDKLTLVCELDARTAPTIAPHSRVKLRYLGDLVWQGVSLTTTWSAGIGSSLSHRLTIECVGPDVYLASLPYLQIFNLLEDPDLPETSNTYESDISSAGVGYGYGSLADIVNVAVTKVFTAGFPVSTDTTNIPVFTPTSERLTDVTCLEAVQRMQGWMPGVKRRWNHGASDSTAKLEWFSVLRPDNILELPESQLDPREIELTSMSNWTGSQRIDLLVADYTIKYLRKRQNTDVDGRVRVVLEELTDNATAANGSPISRASVIRINGIAWNSEGYVSGQPFPELGQSKLLLAPFADVYYDLNFTTELDWTWQPLVLVNVTDAAPGFEDAWACVKSVSHSLRNDKTTVVAGSPSGINPKRAITRPARSRVDDTIGDDGAQTFGFEDTGDKGTVETDLTLVAHDGWRQLRFKTTLNVQLAEPITDSTDQVPTVNDGVVGWSDLADSLTYEEGTGIDITDGVISVDLPTITFGCDDEWTAYTPPPPPP